MSCVLDGVMHEIDEATHFRPQARALPTRENPHHFRMSVNARFTCGRCSSVWTSAKCTVELSWTTSPPKFLVVAYGQKCKRCARQSYQDPVLDEDEESRAAERFVAALTHRRERTTSHSLHPLSSFLPTHIFFLNH
eukprot:TRINITY_DN5220_c0_g1_i1.p2 TRINITY_DN5220_c0_g1~~TRINITY_DN5220_c0_g1_i1.p2  ORF type:complete len:136 (+),score=14.53 TRINITY_DN5220_c0_g1_i1:188-595(+)